jgi:hypothetical protein
MNICTELTKASAIRVLALSCDPSIRRSRCFQVEVVHGIFHPLLHLSAHRDDPHYLHHNVNALAMLQINVRELLPIDASFFQTFLEVQGVFAFLLTVLVAPPLILARSCEQRVAALPLPAAVAY